MAGTTTLRAPAGDVTVAEALARLQAWHASVAKSGIVILETYKAQGMSVPCEVRSKHNKAVSEYLRAARSVFEQLRARGVGVTQKIVGANGSERMLPPSTENPFPSPVAPISFIVADCRSADQGLGVGPVGLVIAGAVVTILLVLGKQLAERITWPGGPPPPYDQVADAYMKCIEKLGPERAAAECAPLRPTKHVDFVSLAIAGALVIGVGLGGILLWRALSSSGAQEAAA